jgi:acyl dehydratase
MSLAVDHLEEGQTRTHSARFDLPEVQLFADLSGDRNPLHLHGPTGRRSRFGVNIVHGALTSSLISAALAKFGTRDSIVVYLDQHLDFLKPVSIGERLTGVAEIVVDLGGGNYSCDVRVVTAEGDRVIEGTATILLDPLTERKEL